jgi:hypothetical protein
MQAIQESGKSRASIRDATILKYLSTTVAFFNATFATITLTVARIHQSSHRVLNASVFNWG